MAISFAQNYFRNSAGVQWEIMGRFSLDSSYPAGGYPIDPLQFGLSQVTSFVVNDSQAGFVYDYNATTQKLMVYTATGGAAIFTGDPAVLTGTNAPSAVAGTADAQVFTGNALAGHAHDITIANTAGTYATWRIYHGAVAGGPFVVGETVSDAFVNTGTVSAVNAGSLDFSAHVDAFQTGVLLTGGTSGATATATSGLVGRVTPGSTPLFITGATINGQPMISVPDSTLIENTQPCVRITSGIIEGSTRDWDSTPNDDYVVTYAIAASTSVSAGTPTGTNAASTLSASTAAAQIWTQGPYTPTGTIAAGGAGLVEVAAATDLSTVTNVEYRVVGL